MLPDAFACAKAGSTLDSARPAPPAAAALRKERRLNLFLEFMKVSPLHTIFKKRNGLNRCWSAFHRASSNSTNKGALNDGKENDDRDDADNAARAEYPPGKLELTDHQLQADGPGS